jgi:hypothetical protein
VPFCTIVSHRLPWLLLAGLIPSPTVPASAQRQESPKHPNDCSEGIPVGVFKKVIREQFTSLVSPRSVNTVGSFAAVDLKEAKAAFAATTIVGNGSVLAVKTSGVATNGLLPILSGSQLNTELAFGAEYHFLAKQRRYVIYDLASCRAFLAARYKLLLETEQKVVADSLTHSLLRLDTLRLGAARRKLQAEFETAVDDKRDSLFVEIAKNTVAFGTKAADLKVERSRRIAWR